MKVISALMNLDLFLIMLQLFTPAAQTQYIPVGHFILTL